MDSKLHISRAVLLEKGNGDSWGNAEGEAKEDKKKCWLNIAHILGYLLMLLVCHRSFLVGRMLNHQLLCVALNDLRLKFKLWDPMDEFLFARKDFV